MTAEVAPTSDLGQLVELCALDSELFCKTFFRDTFSQQSAPFHQDIWDMLENDHFEKVAISAFRGSAKTTIARAYIAKRIAYGIGAFSLLASETSTHSVSSLAWIKQYIEGSEGVGDLFKVAFGLEKGAKWSEDHIEVWHRGTGKMISVRALGVEGQVRGLNLKGKRPDLIYLDDPCNKENSSTEDAQRALQDLVYGALLKSITPRTECPEAKVILTNTPIAHGDLIFKAEQDPSWRFLRVGCFFRDADGERQSTWPSRFTMKALEADEETHRRMRMLSVFVREMECELVSDEESYFAESWLKFYDETPDWATSTTRIGAVDPVPPPSEAQQAKGLAGKDDEGLAVVGFAGRRAILLDLRLSSGHNPDWTIDTFFALQERWRCQSWRVEGVAYQRTLKWMLEQAMKDRKRWVQIDAEADNRKKMIRLRQIYTMVCAEGELWVPRSAVRFLEQWRPYPVVKHDDALDVVAMALQRGVNLGLFGAVAEASEAAEDEEYDREEWLVAP